MKELTSLSKQLKEKYNLTDFGFDSECIYQLGDLSSLLKDILRMAFPSIPFAITEKTSGDEKSFIATVTHNDISLNLEADTHYDFLPERFFDALDTLPDVFNTGKKFYTINPIFLGQNLWFFCGTAENLRNARNEGLPIIYPGENPMQAEEYKKFV